MRREIEQTLEKLVTATNSTGRPIITGFNYHPVCLEMGAITAISLSNIHSSQVYLKEVMADLNRMGYPNVEVSVSTRDKRGYFRWRPNFFIRDEKGVLEENLRIKDIETGEYLDLDGIPHRTLCNAGYSEEEIARLVAENGGYEIDILSSVPEHIRRMAGEFLKKSAFELYDDTGELISEMESERNTRGPWPDAWETPILIIGGNLSQMQGLPGFHEAHLFRFQGSEIGEFLFVTHKEIEVLRSNEEYNRLIELGFREELCLGNTRFIKECVDKV
ncbi:MAG TPA: hypothetical protein VJG90_09260 [Candidatus Nanoarchaeia archaeon]|nr:hypothetical protein [Candidatus Nanoarchaeia archaeon]